MDSSQIVELETLLSAATGSVAISRGPSDRMHPRRYRELSLRCRQVYDPISRHQVASFRLEVQNTRLKEDLLAYVSAELSDYVRDGKIQSAQFVINGGPVGGSGIDKVVENLLRLTVLDSPKVAAKAFYACVTNANARYCQFYLLPTISIREPVVFFGGLKLLPLSTDINELPPHLPNVDLESNEPGMISGRHLVGRTIACVERSVSPIFHLPEASYTLDNGPDKHFIVSQPEKLAEIDFDVFYQALSIVCRRSVKPAMTWTSLADYEVFQIGTMWGIGGSGYSVIPNRLSLENPLLLKEQQVEAVEILYKAILTLSSDVWAKLRIPVDRWMKSTEQSDPIDQLLELGIALETLYLPESQSEVNFRLGLHGAWHLGKSATERVQLMSEFREIYAARSDIVHAGRLRGKRGKPSFDVQAFVTRAQELCWQGITAVIDSGRIPDWEALITGKD